MNKINEGIRKLYPNQHEEVYIKVMELINEWKQKIDLNYKWVNENDIMLITYGDAIQRKGEMPLQTLKGFLDDKLNGIISAVHILPMFPYTSDDGFSVADYYNINPELGSWSDIEGLRENYDLMFDAVINHASSSSEYFKEFLKKNGKYKNFFIVADANKDYSMVTRPRALPLLTRFETADGPQHIWTTFSEDQIDFNFKEPEALLEMLNILLLYVSKGARFLRFDAIGFAWKEDNTTCMHLPQTHDLIKLMRAVLESCAKGCTIITETNVPHKDNISYFGNGQDEAGLVYQFPLPPLTYHSYISGEALDLSNWAASLETTSYETTYFNVLSSHDGIGLRPVEDILSKDKIDSMMEATLKRGGKISYRTMADGSQVAYELNINYFDAIAGNETEIDIMVQKYLSSQCILLSIVGMPAIYYHSILGSRNSYKDYEETGIKRRINREKLDLDILDEEFQNKKSLRSMVFDRYCEMIIIRKQHKAFSPNSMQKIIFLDRRIFALIRGDEQEKILVLINVSKDAISLNTEYKGVELFNNQEINGEIDIKPYGYQWILLN